MLYSQYLVYRCYQFGFNNFATYVCAIVFFMIGWDEKQSKILYLIEGHVSKSEAK